MYKTCCQLVENPNIKWLDCTDNCDKKRDTTCALQTNKRDCYQHGGRFCKWLYGVCEPIQDITYAESVPINKCNTVTKKECNDDSHTAQIIARSRYLTNPQPYENIGYVPINTDGIIQNFDTEIKQKYKKKQINHSTISTSTYFLLFSFSILIIFVIAYLLKK
jgi:hypothetical protein